MVMIPTGSITLLLKTRTKVQAQFANAQFVMAKDISMNNVSTVAVSDMTIMDIHAPIAMVMAQSDSIVRHVEGKAKF